MPDSNDEIALDPVPRSVRRARHFFVRYAATRGIGAEVTEVGALALSEVVTNALLHAPGPIRLRLFVDGDMMHVEVSDTSDRLPDLANPQLEGTSGRGLAIVAAVTAQWGVEPDPGQGKTVWFTLPINSRERSNR